MLKQMTELRISRRLPILIVIALVVSFTSMSYINYVRYHSTTKEFISSIYFMASYTILYREDIK